MKIALLGASYSGKTVYFSALGYKFRNAIAFAPLSQNERGRYDRIQAQYRAGLRIGIRSTLLEKELSTNIKLLAAKPITKWPQPTEALDEATIDCSFRFEPIQEDNPDDIASHRRSIELYDPTGGALTGDHFDSENIVSTLRTCDVAIAFLSCEAIITAVENDDIDELQNTILLGSIMDIVEETRAGMEENDVLPLCLVFSKYDVLSSRHEIFVNKFNEMVFDGIIKPLSREKRNLLLCVCPISVLNPETGNFRGQNLEWPFLFAAGGTIFRNSLVLRDDARDAIKRVHELNRDAEEIIGQGWWYRFQRFMEGEGVGARRRQAREELSRHGRLIRESDDDRSFARMVWTSLAIEGKDRGVRIFLGGNEVDPRKVTG